MIEIISQADLDTLGVSQETSGTGNDCRSEPVAADDCKAPIDSPPSDYGAIGRLRPHPLLQTLPLDAEHVAAFVPSCSRVAVLDRAALALLGRLPIGDAAPDVATIEALHTLRELRLVTAGDGSLPTPRDSNTLSAWLHVTNACNLRCRYCYLDKTNELMSEATAHAAIDAVFRSALAHGFRAVLLKYAGGEATLALPLVASMHAYARQQAARYGVELHAGLLSNGTTLDAAKLAVIRALGLGLMISLDGLGYSNDTQRPAVGGQATSVAVRQGIELAVASGVRPTVAITVTGQSVAGLPELIDWLLERDLRFTVSFYRENDCSSSYAQLRLDETRLIEGMRAAYAVVARNPPRWSVLDALLDRADLSAPHGYTCAAGHNYLVIDHYGRVAKCQMLLHQPVATVDDANPLALIRADQIGLQNVPVDQKEGCRACEWRYWCAGGCAVATFRATGRYDIQSPNCAIYKALYPELLRLEGLRLLHWFAQAQVGAGA